MSIPFIKQEKQTANSHTENDIRKMKEQPKFFKTKLIITKPHSISKKENFIVGFKNDGIFKILDIGFN